MQESTGKLYNDINPKFLKRGYIQIFQGEGKGKTTAAIGLATRALGRDWKVLIMQFCKNENTGEYKSLKKLAGNNLVYKCSDNNKIPFKNGLTDDDKYSNLKSWWYVIHNYKEYDLIILDELNIAVELGMVHLEDVIKFLDSKPKRLEVVITGRNANPEVLNRAHLVTNMTCIKHYWDIGVQAREGIEY